MKNLGIIVVLLAALTPVFSQETYPEIRQDEIQDYSYGNDDRELVIGRNILRIQENDTSVNIRLGKRGVTILESLENGNTEIKVERYDEDTDEWVYRDEDRKRRRNRFKGHWAGVELGYNNYTSSHSRHIIPDPIDYMTLHSAKSNNFNINFAQLSLGLSRHAGFVTGLGLNWNNYRFDGNNNIVKGTGGMIEILNPAEHLEKSKLTTLYLTVPFLFELQLPVYRGNHLDLAAGPIGAVKLSSHSKMVFEERRKVKSHSDFNLNLLRYGATVRAGYSNFHLYGTYYMTPMFRAGDGPGGWDLYPFEVGVAFTFNN